METVVLGYLEEEEYEGKKGVFAPRVNIIQAAVFLNSAPTDKLGVLEGLR